MVVELRSVFCMFSVKGLLRLFLCAHFEAFLYIKKTPKGRRE